ncbi:MAG: L-threonine 3-dehydrogenase [Candidatus Aenigmarchaeota archaeon]|nr:L-threonine 3-dehydrogenase [Candidatus Aenigmarchaeota archaeon]
MQKMKAVAKMQKAKGLEMTEAEVPQIGQNDVLVEVKACSLCGTDVHIYNWDHPWPDRIKPPRTLGHEVCGIVVEKGSNVTAAEVGDFISAESHIADNTCYQCRIGNSNICMNMKLLGVDINGSFAEYVSVPQQNIWKNPKSMPYEIATLQESMGNSVYTVEESNVNGKNVVIFGAGPTGLFATGISRVLGASQIMVVVGTEFHARIAKQMGADIIINRHEQDVVKEIKSATDGIGADVVLEMSGAGDAIDQSLKSLRQGGQLTLLGLPLRPISIDWSKDIVLKDINIKGINGRKLWQTWVTTSRLLHSKRIDITPIITHKLPLEKYEEAIAVAAAGQSGKVVMFPK